LLAKEYKASISISSRPWIKEQGTNQIYLANRQDMKTNQRTKGNRMSREKARRRGSTVHYMFRREKRQKIVGGNPRDIKMRSFGKDK
jgi:hypothetical protein